MKLQISLALVPEIPSEVVLSFPLSRKPFNPGLKRLNQKVVKSIELPLGWIPKLKEYRDVIGNAGFAVFGPADRKCGTLAGSEPAGALNPAEASEALKDEFDSLMISWEVRHE